MNKMFSEFDTESEAKRLAYRNPATNASELERIAPRGVRMACVPVALGQAPLDELPEFAAQWLVKHKVLRPAGRSDRKWTKGKTFDTFLKSVAQKHG